MREKEEETRIRVGARGVEEAAKQKDVVLVIDVLRASSTIITAIGNGALVIVPALTVNQARTLAKSIPDSILGGERKGLRIPGFGLGNSPLEYTAQAVRNKNIVFTTTNCTKVLDRCRQLPSTTEVLIGAFLNATAIARVAREFSARQDRGISIIQAGSNGKSSLDDLVCAELIKTMIENKTEQQLTSEMQSITNSLLYTILSNTKHGKYLIDIGFGDDIGYCSQVNITTVIPRLHRQDGAIPSIEILR